MRASTRRTFLKRAAAGAAGLTLLPRHVRGANDRLDIAIIGTGNISRSHLNTLPTCGGNIVALCDVDARQIAAVRREFAWLSRAKTYADYRRLLERERSIDAVVIATPDHWHAALCTAVMQAGKHVYCEKPLTRCVGEARDLRVLARASSVVTQLGNQGSASPSMRRGVEVVQAGILGQVSEVHVCIADGQNLRRATVRPTGEDPVPTGFNWDFWIGPSPFRPFKEHAYHPLTWRGWYDFGTGHLGDFGCHALNLPVRALKLNYPDTINISGNYLGKESYISEGTIELLFPARQNLAPLKIIWYDGGVQPPPEVFREMADRRPHEQPRGVVLVGEKGKLFTNAWNMEAILKMHDAPNLKDVLRHEAVQDVPTSLPRVESHQAEWVAACKGGPATYSSFEVGGHLTEIVAAGVLALRLGRSIEWNGETMEAAGMADAAQFVRPAYRPAWL